MTRKTTGSVERIPRVATTRIALLIIVPLALLLGARAISWAVSVKSWSDGEVLTAADLNENFAAVKTELDALQPLACGDEKTRLIAGAATCKALNPNAGTFVACGLNGQQAAEVCASKLSSAELLDWWQFNFYTCNDPTHPCVDFALGASHGAESNVIGSDRAVVCCRY